MSDLIRSLIESRLPSDAIAGQGDYLYGQSVAGLAAKQDGEVDDENSPVIKLQKMAYGMRPNPAVNQLQLDR
jgi:hypothetical protein